MGLRNRLLYDKGHRHPISTTMKAFIFLCLVAAAMAEADPQFLYNSYSSYYPSTYAYGGAYSPYTYGNFYGTRHFYKREAEAEVDPALLYSSGVHGVHYPMTYGIHNYGYSHAAAYPYTYGYAHHYGKREAEADPALLHPYTSGLTHYPMTYGVHNFYSRPYGYSRGYGYSSYRPYSYGTYGYRGYY